MLLSDHMPLDIIDDNCIKCMEYNLIWHPTKTPHSQVQQLHIFEQSNHPGYLVSGISYFVSS